MWRHRCVCLCGAQPRDTNYKPISSLPPPSLPPPAPIGGGTGGRGRQTPSFEGGPPPQCLTFIWINTFDQFHPPGKISFRPLCPALPLPSILPSPALPSLPPPPQCLTFIRINTFDQFCPQVKFSTAPLPRPSPPSRPLFNASPSLGSIGLHLINSALR